MKQIFSIFSTAKLKAFHIQKSTVFKPPDLKASNFKCLRRIELTVVHRFKDKKISLQEISSEGGFIKQLHKTQKAFVKGANSYFEKMPYKNSLITILQAN